MTTDDHWKPYFKLDRAHSICNAHHLRELERAGSRGSAMDPGGRDTRELLLAINTAVDDAGWPPVAGSIPGIQASTGICWKRLMRSARPRMGANETESGDA